MERKQTSLKKIKLAQKESPIITDPQGCYTGKPIEMTEQPIQDADDL